MLEFWCRTPSVTHRTGQFFYTNSKYRVDKELIINSSPTQVEIALVENRKLVEIHSQKTKDNFNVGDIFLGNIKKTMPGLNAAFVDLGHRKDAFLHYTDLGPQINSLRKYTKGAMEKSMSGALLNNFELEPDNPKNGKIDQVFGKRDHVLVQVLKEPISTKGPRLSCEITIPGRYVVLTPFSDTVAISKKITNDEERKRLKVLVESIKPKNFGVVVRTASEGKKVADLHSEIKGLTDKWEVIYSELLGASEPKKILSEIDKTNTLLRDLLSEDFNKVVVDDTETYKSIKQYLGEIAPEKVSIVQQHKGGKHIFEAYGINRQIKASFGKTYTMSSGAYLVIEHTEAMHVIDVNSGPKMQKRDQQEASFAVNLESAEEVARQVRLRDIGGIIIIDFIDMRNSDHKQSLYRKMKDFMAGDRAQHTILPLSKFGLMAITRQRVRPAIKIDTSEKCPTCQGSGKAKASILIMDDIERDIEYILSSRPKSKLQLKTHPFIFAHIKKGVPSLQMRWYMKYKCWIKVTSEADFHMLEYKFFDDRDDEIRLE